MAAETTDRLRESLSKLLQSGLQTRGIGRMLSLCPKLPEVWTGDCRKLLKTSTFRGGRWSKLSPMRNGTIMLMP